MVFLPFDVRTCQEKNGGLFAEFRHLHTELASYQIVAFWHLNTTLHRYQKVHPRARKVFLLVDPSSAPPAVLDQSFEYLYYLDNRLVGNVMVSLEISRVVFEAQIAIEKTPRQLGPSGRIYWG
jgi:hypothetical protein